MPPQAHWGCSAAPPSSRRERWVWGDRIGSLEPNKQADLLLLDLTGPNLTPMFHDPVVTIVYNACRGDVTDVMVGGRFTVRHRRLQTMDAAEILHQGQKVAMEVYGRHLAALH